MKARYTAAGRYIERDGKPFIYLQYHTSENGERSCDPVDIDTLGPKIAALLNAAALPDTWDQAREREPLDASGRRIK